MLVTWIYFKVQKHAYFMVNNPKNLYHLLLNALYYTDLAMEGGGGLLHFWNRYRSWDCIFSFLDGFWTAFSCILGFIYIKLNRFFQKRLENFKYSSSLGEATRSFQGTCNNVVIRRSNIFSNIFFNCNFQVFIDVPY